MNIKSRIAKLEMLGGTDLKVIVPAADFSGGCNEDCTHAIASLQEGESFEAMRKPGESYSDFYRRFVSRYIADFQRQLSSWNLRVVVLGHDTELL